MAKFDGQYEVYRIVGAQAEEDGISVKKEVLAVCESLKVAERIAQALVGTDPNNTYCVSMVESPGCFIPGGGFSVSYYMERKEIS